MTQITTKDVINTILRVQLENPTIDVFDRIYPSILEFNDEGDFVQGFDCREVGEGDSYSLIKTISDENLMSGAKFAYIGPGRALNLSDIENGREPSEHRVLLIIVSNGLNDNKCLTWDYDQLKALGDTEEVDLDSGEGPISRAIMLLATKLHVNKIAHLIPEEKLALIHKNISDAFAVTMEEV